MKNFIKVVIKNSGTEMRINANSIVLYEAANGCNNVTDILLVGGKAVRVLGTPEEIDNKIEECLC